MANTTAREALDEAARANGWTINTDGGWSTMYRRHDRTVWVQYSRTGATLSVDTSGVLLTGSGKRAAALAILRAPS